MSRTELAVYMESRESVLRKLRFHERAAAVAMIALLGLSIWSSSALSRHDRIVVDVFYIMAWIGLVAYVGRVISPLKSELKRSKPS